MSASAPKRCLFLEVLGYHEENFPHWLRLLADLGCSADLYARPEVHRKNVLEPCSSLRNYRLCDLGELPRRGKGYDFVLLNSLLGAGFDRAVPASFRPLLHHVGELGRPSISVVHEPAFWGEMYPQRSFTELRGVEANGLHLHRCGTFHRDHRGAKPGVWRLEGSALRLRSGDDVEVWHRGDGDTFLGEQPGHRLVRRPADKPALAEFLGSGANLLLTLSPQGAHYLRPLYGDVRWIHPGYYGDFPEAGPPRRRIALPGIIDYSRKNYRALFAAAEEVRRLDLPIYVVGGTREAKGFAASANVRRLREDLERHGLTERVLFTGPLSYVEYLDFVRRSAFVLPLVDETVESGAYLTKLSMGVALSIAFGVPTIVSARMLEPYGLELETSYPGTDLAAGLRALKNVDAGVWTGLRSRLLAKREELRGRSRETVRQALAEIL